MDEMLQSVQFARAYPATANAVFIGRVDSQTTASGFTNTTFIVEAVLRGSVAQNAVVRAQTIFSESPRFSLGVRYRGVV
jgi:hypothetical protein